MRGETSGSADLTSSRARSLLEAGGNYLLIGSDSRAFVNGPQDAQAFGSAQQQTGQRSDTIMVVHIDNRTGTALLVSFPRDLWVAIPGMGSAKIFNSKDLDALRLAYNVARTKLDNCPMETLIIDENGDLERAADLTCALKDIYMRFNYIIQEQKSKANVLDFDDMYKSFIACYTMTRLSQMSYPTTTNMCWSMSSRTRIDLNQK